MTSGGEDPGGRGLPVVRDIGIVLRSGTNTHDLGDRLSEDPVGQLAWHQEELDSIKVSAWLEKSDIAG